MILALRKIEIKYEKLVYFSPFTHGTINTDKVKKPLRERVLCFEKGNERKKE